MSPDTHSPADPSDPPALAAGHRWWQKHRWRTVNAYYAKQMWTGALLTVWLQTCPCGRSRRVQNFGEWPLD